MIRETIMKNEAQFFSGKNTWWYAECPIHGKTEHGTAWGGCIECAKEKTVRKNMRLLYRK